MVNSDATLRMYLQYYEKEINLTRLAEKAFQEASVRCSVPVQELQVYVKPEDGRAYYVVNGGFQSFVNLWDSDRDIMDCKLSGEIDWLSRKKHRLIFEYRGHQCDCDSIIDRVVEKYKNVHAANKMQEIEIYIRQEHEAAYYVINGRHTGSVSMFA
ncbi:MAG: hypothetical protein K2P45_15865 [Eubacterium sp.]|nr:hypothetical protein [Eubacterium sp.]